MATQYPAVLAHLAPHDLKSGDRILGWFGEDDAYVDVREDRGCWTVDGVPIVRPEDAPSYRRHRHGYVQVCFADSRIDYPEDARIDVARVMGSESGTVRLAFLATLLLAVVPVSLVALFLASLAGAVVGVVV